MAFFNKKISESKWLDVGLLLGQKLKKYSDEFYPTFLKHTEVQGLKPSLSEKARHLVDMMQLQAVASTIVENGYSADPAFSLELIYIVMTERLPAQMHADISNQSQELMSEDARTALHAWSSMMAIELSRSGENSALSAELAPYGALLVVQAKIATCAACGDHRGAEKVRKAMT